MSGQNYVVISADSHDGPPSDPNKLKPYLEAKFHEPFDKIYSDSVDNFMTNAFIGRASPSADYNPDPFKNWQMETLTLFQGKDRTWMEEAMNRYWPEGEPPGLNDAKARVAAQETQGIVAEVIYTLPSVGMDVADPELRRAVELAGMRWLVDYCNEVPGRLAGVITVGYEDLETSLADIRRFRDEGLFGGVIMPTPGKQRAGRSYIIPDLPPIVDPHWNPLWALCEELGLPLIAHVGTNRAPRDEYGTDPRVGGVLDLLEISFFGKRIFFHLLASGALGRHPNLKVGFLEHPAGSLAGLLHEADQLVQSSLPPALLGGMLPSEYWYRHGFISSHMYDDHDLRESRYQIGIENVMFGSDYPQTEGMWPINIPSLRHQLGGLPEGEIRAILGENAAKVFGFDLAALQKIADEVGPSVDDLSTPLPQSEIPQYHPGMRWSPYRLKTGPTSPSA